MRDLPNVTVVIIDTVAHMLVQDALQDTLDQINPAETLIFADKELLRNSRVTWIKVEANSLSSVADILWYKVPLHIRTSHYLVIQWDGWVHNGNLWQDNWLNYDYIGALWPWHPNNRVGNGGFSLRSRALGMFLTTNKLLFPLSDRPEDDTLCRTFRPRLEYNGFRWAPEDEASLFSFERRVTDYRPTFGFHGAFNFPKVLSPERLRGRIKRATRYVESTVAWKELQAQLGES